MGRKPTNRNFEEKFSNDNKFQFAEKNDNIKENYHQKRFLGSASRKSSTDGKPSLREKNSFYTTTRLSMDGKDKYGNPYYKREVILFKSRDEFKKFQELKPSERDEGGVGSGTIIATGSTKPGEKSFELTEEGAKLDYVKKNEDKIQWSSRNDVRNIAKDNKNITKGVKEFSDNRKANSKDDAIDSKAAEIAAEKKLKSLDKKLARGHTSKSVYPRMFYPSHIADSVQDKLKITILKPKDTNSSSSKRKRFAAAKTGSQLLPSDYKNLDPSKYPKLAAAFNNKQGKYVGYGIRSSFARSQDKIYAAGENSGQSEFDKTPIGHIFLPIPDGVTDQNKVNFGEGKLNPVEKITSGLALQFLLGEKGAQNLETSKALGKKIKDPNTKRALSNLIAGSATGVDTDELLARTQGSILNNNLALLFKGPTLRTFTFQFMLSPRDSGESEQVRQIIRALKQSSAAQRTRAGTFLGAPNTYRLQFLNGLQPHGFLPRIKECALLSVGVNYMPENSYMTYENTSMVSYSLSLSFQELESLYNDDYDSDNETPVTKIEDGIFDVDFAGQANSRGIGF